VDLRRQLAVVALVYVIEGFPMGISGVFGFYFASQRATLASIGLLGWLSLAWSLKVLWSPVVERYGSRQQWIASSLVAMAGALCAVAWLPAHPIGAALWAALVSYYAASATQDIAIDAYTIGLVDRANLGPANAVRTAAYRVGTIASSGLLLLPDRFGWRTTFLAGAALSLLFAISLTATPAIALPPPTERRPFAALARWGRRPGALPVLAFVLLFRVGDKAMGPMVAPFWVQRGFGPAEYGAFTGLVGALIFVAGGVAAGAWMARVGMVRGLWITGALALLSNLGYAAVAASPDSGKLAVYAAAAVESLTSGAVGAVFVAYLMSICDKRHAAVEYALLSSLYAAAGAVLAGASGWITEAVGFAGYFALTAAFAAPAFAFLSRAARWASSASAAPLD
jgi:PAT family beta-lactamase induction signal transducer AmpG